MAMTTQIDACCLSHKGRNYENASCSQVTRLMAKTSCKNKSRVDTKAKTTRLAACFFFVDISDCFIETQQFVLIFKIEHLHPFRSLNN